MDPYEERRRSMKEHKAYHDRVQYVSDAMNGIPERCACGKSIVCERALAEEFDFLPGKRFFTCRGYMNDGLHYRQPWVCAVEEELERMKRKVDDHLEFKCRVGRQILEFQMQEQKVDVEKLIGRVSELETIKRSEDENAELKSRVAMLEMQSEELKAEVEKLIGRVSELEYAA